MLQYKMQCTAYNGGSQSSCTHTWCVVYSYPFTLCSVHYHVDNGRLYIRIWVYMAGYKWVCIYNVWAVYTTIVFILLPQWRVHNLHMYKFMVGLSSQARLCMPMLMQTYYSNHFRPLRVICIDVTVTCFNMEDNIAGKIGRAYIPSTNLLL